METDNHYQTQINNLKAYKASEDEYNFNKRAAVLVPLILVENQLHILLTLRSRHLRSHAGEVCFPGGKVDETDPSLIHTALREADEEVGLPAELVEIIGMLEPGLSRSNILVTPVMSLIKGG
jgi:8-oxo-dGTP pyrophosphatase MutT (NUDIX family)